MVLVLAEPCLGAYIRSSRVTAGDRTGRPALHNSEWAAFLILIAVGRTGRARSFTARGRERERRRREGDGVILCSRTVGALLARRPLFSLLFIPAGPISLGRCGACTDPGYLMRTAPVPIHPGPPLFGHSAPAQRRGGKKSRAALLRNECRRGGRTRLRKSGRCLCSLLHPPASLFPWCPVVESIRARCRLERSVRGAIENARFIPIDIDYRSRRGEPRR